jgi:hypothetical protein
MAFAAAVVGAVLMSDLPLRRPGGAGRRPGLLPSVHDMDADEERFVEVLRGVRAEVRFV